MYKKIDLPISILAIIVGLLILFCSDYISEKPYNSTYIGSVYKSKGYIEGVFQLDDSKIIVDKAISSGFYLMMKPGDKYILRLREMDIKQTPLNNFLFFFFPFILMSVGIFRILFKYLL